MEGTLDLVSGDQQAVWVDDWHPIFRRGLAASLMACGYTVVAETSTFQDVDRIADDIVVVFGATEHTVSRIAPLLENHTTVAIVNGGDEQVFRLAVQAGVSAVLSRSDMTPEVLVGTVRAALSGASVYPSEALSALLDGADAAPSSGPIGLTDRELAVLRHLAEGADTRDIAGALSYSERTVKNVVHDLLTKMNCRNRAHAVAQATRQGMI